MDLILFNGNIITMDEMNAIAKAVAIKDGIIYKVGTDKEILRLKTNKTKIIDLNNKTVIPGINDSHVHLLNYGYSLIKVDCSSAKSIEEIIRLGKEFIDVNKPNPGEWVLGRGWNQIIFNNKREINKYDLDKITTEHPLSFTRICEHITVANSKAIEVCGITKDTPQPLGGHFDIDEKGEPTGIFREAARYMIYENVPNVSKDDIKKMLVDVSKIASSYGITSVQTDDFETFANRDYEMVMQAYNELVSEKALPIRIYEQCLLPEIDRLEGFLDSGYRTGQGNEYFKIGPLKLLTDGSLGGRTAFLCEPYSDDPSNRGMSTFTQEELDNLIVTAHKNGMQILTHAIGDGAMYMCFNSFEKAQSQYPNEDPRFGIVHLQITDEKLLNKFKELNVIANAEPICVNNDLHMAKDRVGKDRAKTSYKYRTLVEDGVHVCISSDCPVDSLNSMNSIYVAVTRKDYSGYPNGGWYPEECLTVEQALYAFTMGSAYASFEENIKGSIEEKKFADIAVISDDIYKVSLDKIKDIVVEMTIMDGNIVYKRER
ncbi:MAG: amidohydrolase [Peptostreptococcaceae bacterium]|nr:amidohydrolase [Peptostreptococcaceae bacterium]